MLLRRNSCITFGCCNVLNQHTMPVSPYIMIIIKTAEICAFPYSSALRDSVTKSHANHDFRLCILRNKPSMEGEEGCCGEGCQVAKNFHSNLNFLSCSRLLKQAQFVVVTVSVTWQPCPPWPSRNMRGMRICSK